MEYLQGVGPYYTDHDDFVKLNRAILDSYEPKHAHAFFTICSWAKPYSASYIHRGIRKAFREGKILNEIDYIHISSAGIIPAEAELWAVNYDWNNSWVQDELTSKLLRERIAKRLSDFIGKFSYENKFVYLRPLSNTLKAIQSIGNFENDFTYVFPATYNKRFEYSSKELYELHEIRADGLHPDLDDLLILPSILAKTVSKIRKELGL